MIVFIATVLVAAVAAAVLLDTSGKLQERSGRTGQQATEQVSSNLAIDSVYGQRDANTDACLDDLYVYLSLAPGASTVDLGQLKIQLQNGTSLKTFDHINGAPTATTFNVTSVRDTDSSFTSAKPVMNAGDLVKVSIDLDTAFGTPEAYEPRDTVKIVLIPEQGNKVTGGFTTPNTYGTQTYVDLN